MRIMLIAVTSGLALAMVPSCKSRRDNPNHCQNNEGNDWCSERFPDRPFCSIGACTPDVEDGCMADRPVEDACYSPCGDDQTFEDDPSCDGVAETGTDATTVSTSDTTPSTSGDPTTMSSMSMSGTDTDTDATTEPTTETGPTGCVGSEECTDPGSPVCVDEVCVPCTEAGDGDAACAEKDSEAPACGGSGECVQCTDGNPVACDGTTPVCDAGSSSCVGCTYHEQCTDACNMNTGACLGDCVNVVMAGQNIQDAIADGCVVQVGAGVYNEAVVVDSAIAVAIIGVADGARIRSDGSGDPGLSVSGGANVFVENMEISGNDSGVGVSVSGANVWLDRTEVVTNTGGGIELTSNANAVVRNCFVGGNVSDVVALSVDGANADVLYSTLIAASFGSGAALRCAGNEAPTVRNSIVVMQGADDEIQCASADVTYSATESNTRGTGNVMLDDVVPGWFTNLAGDFHLTGTAPIEIQTAAQWRTADPAADPPRLANDPATDIDGDLRPTVADTADVAGADIP